MAGVISLSIIGLPYTQDFDTLAVAETSSTSLNSLNFHESRTNANSTHTAGMDSGNGGDAYDFGSSGENDRAFNGPLSDSLAPTTGAQLVNDTGVPISSLKITYEGEQWRLRAIQRSPTGALNVNAPVPIIVPKYRDYCWNPVLNKAYHGRIY